GNISIKYMVRPLPSIYLYEEFVSIKIPMTFDDMEEFAKSMQTLMDFQVDVLRTVKLMNKKQIEDPKVYKSEVKDTPQKDREKKKVTNNTLPSYPESPFPGLPGEDLI
ncbi:10406_t:CDS:2, partial [Ambispora leptoticha]